MYISEWKIEEDNCYYQAIVSLKEKLTPFLKIRIIPLVDKEEYGLVIRDYNYGLLLAGKNIEMELGSDGMFANLDTAKKAIEKMVRVYLTGKDGILDTNKL